MFSFEFCEISKNLFYRHLSATASASSLAMLIKISEHNSFGSKDENKKHDRNANWLNWTTIYNFGKTCAIYDIFVEVLEIF